jgi:hypothetical protein
MLRLFFLLIFAVSADSALAQASYGSLEDFCVKTGKDTPENCRCGQATADRILSDEEQATALAMMAYQQHPELSPEEQMTLMDKLSQVTEGCGKDN